ncbi:10840_t:CDS:1, partial [Paraglomus brasilianum]
IMLLLINQVIDGYVNSTQDQVFHMYKITGQQMMFFMNIFTTLLLFAWLSMPWSQELGLAIAFCQRHPAVLKDILLFVSFGALGQCFIFFTLENFESLVLVTITVTRKLFTMLLSVFLFDHHLSRNQWFAVGLVFTGIGLEAYVKQAEKTKMADRVKGRNMLNHSTNDVGLNGYKNIESTDRRKS